MYYENVNFNLKTLKEEREKVEVVRVLKEYKFEEENWIKVLTQDGRNIHIRKSELIEE